MFGYLAVAVGYIKRAMRVFAPPLCRESTTDLFNTKYIVIISIDFDVKWCL